MSCGEVVRKTKLKLTEPKRNTWLPEEKQFINYSVPSTRLCK